MCACHLSRASRSTRKGAGCGTIGSTACSAPTAGDMRYEKPIMLADSAVLRTRAFKDGFTRSVTTQQVFIINKP